MQENNENMSVEDILGSIKDILEDSQDAIVVEDKMNAMDEKFLANDDDEDDDDIFDLSESMMVMPDLSDVAESGLQNEVVDVDFSPVIEEPEIVESNDVEVLDDNYVEKIETFEVKEAADLAFEPMDFNALGMTEDTQSVFEQPTPPDFETADNNLGMIDEIANIIEEAQENDVVATPKAEDITPEPIVSEMKEAQKDDTSVEIINNFAKMFGATPVETKEIDVDVEAVVARSVEKKILDINFDNIANAQIKKWLNDNLSLVVEKVVKEKLEEVLRQNGA